jgi:hypothetical protein
MIGHSPEAYDVYNKIKERLAEVGIEFVGGFNYQTRQDMVEFFKKIDFFVVWWGPYYKNCFYSHPTKLLNAASFGIPSLAEPVDGYREIERFYIHVNNIDDVVKEAKKLKEPDYYRNWSDKVYEEAEKYHISKIAELYKRLL